MIDSICFYFPYFDDSGVPVLFYRLANQIANSNPAISVSIIDYRNGAMWRNVFDLPNLNKIQFDEGSSVSPPDGSVLIMQSFLPYYWPNELVLKPSQRIFFWNLHPQNLVPSVLPFPFLRELTFNNFKIYKFIAVLYPKLFNNLREYVKSLIACNSLCFMDKANLDFTSKYLSLKIEKREFIPIPVDFTNYKLTKPNNLNFPSLIRIGWIGRLCDFKAFILVYAIKKLNEISFKFKSIRFEFHIIGDGPLQSYIFNQVSDCNNIKIKFLGSIPHQDIDNYIINSLDILMSMGTAALEGAKLGVPTFILDFSLSEIKGDYIFRMLYDTVEFDLGHFIDENDFKKSNNSLYDLINDIITNYQFHSIKSHDYFKFNHEILSIQNKLLLQLDKCTFTYSLINSNILNKNWLLMFYNKMRGLDK